MATPAKTYVYKDPQGLRTLLLVLMALVAVVLVIQIGVIAAFGDASIYTGAEEVMTGPQTLRWATDIGYLTIAAAIISGAFWIAQASRNAHSFGRPMKHSVGGSVGWYFVPFANLFLPYKAMREIWTHSAPPGEMETTLLGVWWAFWISASIGTNIAVRIPEAPGLEAFADALLLGALATFALLILKLTRMQRETHAAGVFSDQAEPGAVALSSI